MKKYIIENCPAYEDYLVSLDIDTLEENISDTNICLKRLGDNPHCQDYTDCPLKKIIDLCKEYTCDGIDCAWCANDCNMELTKFANNILKQFKISDWRY